jgi:hypothetical protein
MVIFCGRFDYVKKRAIVAVCLVKCLLSRDRSTCLFRVDRYHSPVKGFLLNLVGYRRLTVGFSENLIDCVNLSLRANSFDKVENQILFLEGAKFLFESGNRFFAN